ncbi:MAG: NAD-dependent epimerase/dehydratase family protein [Halieaceae bacterium]
MNQKIVLLGGAGLVGQNLVVRLKSRGYSNLIVIDKHKSNLATLAKLHNTVVTELADLSQPGSWQNFLKDAHAIVMLQAQIGGNRIDEFEKNNIESTRLVLESIDQKEPPYLVHISSSVVESAANDFYSSTKRAQEELVLASGIPCPVLRPTLMFGWFDRKHLGWLSRFMRKVPVFPIPGNGRYMRQPLYVTDFCNIIINCLERRIDSGIYNITGQQKVYYIDIIREIKRVTKSRTAILPIPYRLFALLLTIWALFDKDPPFTTQQLEALSADDEFELIDWPGIFGVEPTSFSQAINETFNDPVYSKIELGF